MTSCEETLMRVLPKVTENVNYSRFSFLHNTLLKIIAKFLNLGMTAKIFFFFFWPSLGDLFQTQIKPITL